MTQKYTSYSFIEKSKIVHGDLYGYSEFEYVDSKTIGKIICKIHGSFDQTPRNHLRGNGCQICANNKRGKSLTKENFVKKAKQIHGSKYDYSLVEYKNENTKIKIICKIHDVFEQRPHNHLTGNGCSDCKKTKLRKLFISSNEVFIKKAISIHGNLYDYSLVNYVDRTLPIKIICKIHDVFEQKTEHHLQGKGCQKCANIIKGDFHRSTKEDFVEKAEQIHGDKYDYSEFEYIKMHDKSIIICKKHKIKFKQSASNHLQGKGCQKCSGAISKPETKWLDSLNIPLRQYYIKSIKKKVDGYDQATNTVYQFHGDYYHGNPKKYPPCYWNGKLKKFASELYQNTLKSDQLIKDSGYNLVSLWERDLKVLI
jgi:hypothetical protein